MNGEGRVRVRATHDDDDEDDVRDDLSHHCPSRGTSENAREMIGRGTDVRMEGDDRWMDRLDGSVDGSIGWIGETSMMMDGTTGGVCVVTDARAMD
jgi:hypothetical protein